MLTSTCILAFGRFTRVMRKVLIKKLLSNSNPRHSHTFTTSFLQIKVFLDPQLFFLIMDEEANRPTRHRVVEWKSGRRERRAKTNQQSSNIRSLQSASLSCLSGILQDLIQAPGFMVEKPEILQVRGLFHILLHNLLVSKPIPITF